MAYAVIVDILNKMKLAIQVSLDHLPMINLREQICLHLLLLDLNAILMK